MTDTQKDKIEKAINLMANDTDILTAVKSIESGIKTTQGVSSAVNLLKGVA